jgi:NmrA-like family
MTSSPKKTIAIVGATGNQGSSVAHTFLSLPHWHVRCLTRNPSSAAAQTLRALGAELVQGDLSDPASLTAAFSSAAAIFVNTDFWATYLDLATPAKSAAANKTSSQLAFDLEISHGTNIATAVAAVPTLKRFIYSTLGPMTKASHGKYPHSYHWDSKATIVEHIARAQPALTAKMSVIYLGAYVANPLLQPRWDAGAQKYVFALPVAREARMPIIDPVASTGPFVRALVEDEEAGTGLLAYDSDSYLQMGEVVKMWGRVVWREAAFVEVPLEVMHGRFGIPVEVLDGPAFISEFGYMAGVEGWIGPEGLKTKVEMRSFEDWLRRRDWKGVLEQGAG